MKSFIIKSLSIIAIVFVIDCLANVLFKNIYSSFPNISNTTCSRARAILKESPDIVVLGSSTADRHFNSNMMRDSLGLKVYNAGMAGHDIVYCDIVFQSMADRGQINMAVLDINKYLFDGTFLTGNNDLFPFYGLSDAVTAYFDDEASFIQRFKLKSSLYRYNSSLLDIIKTLVESDEDSSNGYRPLEGTVDSLDYVDSDFYMNKEEYDHFESLVRRCKEDGITLVVIESPSWDKCEKFSTWLNDYCKKRNVLFLDEKIRKEYYSHPEWYYDKRHLNNEGANYFTSNVCTNLMPLLIKK